MKRFRYARAESLDEACAFLAQHPCNAKVMAGGTDLVIALRDNMRSVRELEYVLDISGLKSLRGIREKDGMVTIGALTPHAEVAGSALIQSKAHLLAEACGVVGGPQTRARGTVGGNVCNASPCADAATALTALDAVLSISSPSGNRSVPVQLFLAEKASERLAPGELVTQITFAALRENEYSAYMKLGRRKALSIARMNTGVVLEMLGGVIVNARVSMGSAFPHQRRLAGVESLLNGRKPDEGVLEEACAAAAQEMLAITGVRWSTEYKEPVIRTMVKRCIKKALAVE